jgi:hypothetical protein
MRGICDTAHNGKKELPEKDGILYITFTVKCIYDSIFTFYLINISV